MRRLSVKYKTWKYYLLSFLRVTWNWIEWKIRPLFPPFNFPFIVRLSPVKGKCDLSCAAWLQPCPLGVWLWVEGDLSGLIKEQMSPPYHELAPFSETCCKKGLALRETHSSGGTKPPRVSGRKINSSHSKRHWLGRWSFLISSFHKGNKLLFIIDGKPLWSRSSKKPSYEKLWSSVRRKVLNKQSFLIGSGKPLCDSFICEQSIQRRSGVPRTAQRNPKHVTWNNLQCNRFLSQLSCWFLQLNLESLF